MQRHSSQISQDNDDYKDETEEDTIFGNKSEVRRQGDVRVHDGVIKVSLDADMLHPSQQEPELATPEL